MYTKKRMNANHELVICLTNTVVIIAVHINLPPREIILFVNGVSTVSAIIVIIVIVICINVVWLVPYFLDSKSKLFSTSLVSENFFSF